MSRSSSKSALSGLKNVQRDWSEPGSSQELDINWPVTPPPLTAAQKRLKAIQEALKDKKIPDSQPLAPSKTFNKRPSDGAPSEEESVAKKPRQLPVSWNHDHSISASSAAKPSKPPSASTTIQIQMSSAPGNAKIPKVFLSQEQKQILDLVASGLSVFYTGSAGVCIRTLVPLIFIITQALANLSSCARSFAPCAKSTSNLPMLWLSPHLLESLLATLVVSPSTHFLALV